MSLLEIFIIGAGLAMDAFAVSVCKGLAMERSGVREAVIAGLWFGLFQTMMPLGGYLLGMSFSSYVEAAGHWIAFILLCIIGMNMIKETFKGDEEKDSSLLPLKMLPLAVATSIDALAVGITFSFMEVNIITAVLIIGITTFCMCCVGVMLGSFIGQRFRRGARLMGGVVLIIIAFRILLKG